VSESQPEPTAVRIVASPELGDTMALYANFVQLSYTPHDFTLHFGWYTIPALTEPPPPGELLAPVRPLAKVAVPLNLVKAIGELIARQAASWEEAFGPLPDQPSPAAPPAAEAVEETTS
jgi:hypothetical protein